MSWTHLGNHDKTLARLEKNAAKAHNLPTQFCTLSRDSVKSLKIRALHALMTIDRLARETHVPDSGCDRIAGADCFF